MHRNTTTEGLLQGVVARYVQEHVPKPGHFRPDVADPDGPITRVANALLVDAIDSGKMVLDIPKTGGNSVSAKLSPNGETMLLPDYMEPYVRLRLEEMASVEKGTIPLHHAGSDYTAHVVFSGYGQGQTMHLWIEKR